MSALSAITASANSALSAKKRASRNAKAKTRNAKKASNNSNSSKGCTNCGETGHWSTECTMSQVPQSSDSQPKVRCRYCGSMKHFYYECAAHNKKFQRGKHNKLVQRWKNRAQPTYYFREKQGYNLDRKEQNKRGVLEITQLPVGMEEEEIFKFFRQFGEVTRFALLRTAYGRPTGSAYVEYEHKEVAPIVVEAMNTTSMYKKMLEVQVVKPQNVDGQRMFPRRGNSHCKINSKLSAAKWRWDNVARIANLEMEYPQFYDRLRADEEEINANLKKHGIDYEFHGIEEVMEEKFGPSKHKQQRKKTRKGGKSKAQKVGMKSMDLENIAKTNVFLMDQGVDESDVEMEKAKGLGDKSDDESSEEFNW